MTALSAVAVPDRCANSLCPNRPDEGAFVLLETGEAVVGGHRDLRLWMCSPCADALRELAPSAPSPGRTVTLWPRQNGKADLHGAVAEAYERGRQDFAQEALDDLAERGFRIAYWQSYERDSIRRWLDGLRKGQKWKGTK